MIARIALGPACLAVAALLASGGGSPTPATAAAPATAPATRAVDFVRDIQPVLAASCYKCHGPEKRQGQLRLDGKALAFKGGGSGQVIVPGKRQDSLLYKMLLLDDPDERMPRKADPLSKAQIELIGAWIDQGAVWPDAASGVKAEVHWSYAKPTRPAIPVSKKRATWVRNAIDALVLARLEKEGLSPSPEAPREILIRRVTLDLIGLPPTVKDVDAFLADRSPNAYEKVVDRLLASPHYGERWARLWLDLARYADSNGYDEDRPRVMWKWRDWVINALNTDMPFDRFTIEQLAGDMLPGATIDQRIATGFHGNTMLNEEGGVDGEEARYEVLVDRVNTTSSVWLGTTLGCAQCHNHKYDPFSQKDYFGMLAFFDNGQTTEDQRAGANRVMKDPIVRVPTAAQETKLRALEDELAQRQRVLDTQTPELDAAQARWMSEARALLGAWKTLEASDARAASGARLARQKDGSYLVTGKNPANDSYTFSFRAGRGETLTGLRLELLADPALPGSGPGRGPNGGFVLSEIKVEAARGPNAGSGRDGGSFAPVAISKAGADEGIRGSLVEAAFDRKDDTGWSALGGKPHVAVFAFDGASAGAGTAVLRVTLEHKTVHPQHALGRFRIAVTATPEPLATLKLPSKVGKLLLAPAASLSEADTRELAAHHRSIAPLLDPVRKQISDLKKQIDDLKVPTAIVMQERTSFERPSTLLRLRGNFTNPGERLYARVPAALHPMREEYPPNRLGLARWLVDRDNPLTARVTMNRFWEQLFGRGIVETSEDFGAQSSGPTHPELLDWLAVEFIEKGFKMKAIHRLMVTSSTYRQSSVVSPALREKDPYNRLFARGPRFRVEAEIIRDATLATSGLLAHKIGGPSVFPWQPDGIWNVSRSQLKWTTSSGEDRHRRALYTFLRRSAPYPMMTTFDGTSREVCTLRRVRTNTPLQALDLMNDPVFWEAAQALGRRILREAPAADPRARAAHGFRLVVARRPAAADVADLVAVYEKEKKRLATGKAADDVLAGLSDPPASPAERAELGAWTMVANVLLNLDEAQTKE